MDDDTALVRRVREADEILPPEELDWLQQATMLSHDVTTLACMTGAVSDVMLDDMGLRFFFVFSVIPVLRAQGWDVCRDERIRCFLIRKKR